MTHPNWRWLAVAGLVLALAGCRLTRDDKGLLVDPRDDYLDAESGEPLVVPDDLMGTAINDTWPIPEIIEQPIVKVYPRKAPRPAVLVGRDFDAVRIQRLGKRQWIVLGDAPEQVWPMVKQFLAENGVGAGREDPPAGIVESAWIVVADQNYGDVLRTAIREGRDEHAANGGTIAAGRDRLIIRIERGIRRGSTEVHVQHEHAVGLSDETAPAIAEVEAQVVAKLAEYFAAGVTTAVSMVGRNIAAAAKAQVVKDATGYPMLHLHVDFDRAWATVGQALERAEIEAEANHEQATYRVDFPTAGRRGWLKRIVPGGDVGRDTPVAIHVARGETGTQVSVAAPSGEPLSADLAEEVLVTLREFAA